jgi:hypothetical protein
VTEPLDHSCVTLEQTGRALKESCLSSRFRTDDPDDVLAEELEINVFDGEQPTVSSRKAARK